MKKEKKAEQIVDIDDFDLRARLSSENKLSSDELSMLSKIDENAMNKIKYFVAIKAKIQVKKLCFPGP